tara:strand:+ start:379 stop:801 length:423 start_codon:yes stop_codon:yes gene_type:complete
MTDQHSISDDTAVAMPIRNIISIIGAVAVSTWAYSGVIERLNRIETTLEVKAEAVQLNSEFRINWPRGTMGQLPADASQNREIAQLQVELDRVMEEVEENDSWIDEYDPRAEIQGTYESVKDLEIRLAIIEDRLSQLRTQ